MVCVVKDGFSGSHVWMWMLDYKESWALRYWCFWTVVLEKTLESPLDSKEVQPVHPKGNQSWMFNGRTNVEAETPIHWPPDTKNWLIGKHPDAGKDWRWEEKGTTEDEMVGWHHWLNGHEFESTLGVGDEQGGRECYSLWGRKELDTTEWLSWTELMLTLSGIDASVLPSSLPRTAFSIIALLPLKDRDRCIKRKHMARVVRYSNKNRKYPNLNCG